MKKCIFLLFFSLSANAIPQNISNLDIRGIQNLIQSADTNGENGRKSAIRMMEMMKLDPTILDKLKASPSSLSMISSAMMLCRRDNKCKMLYDETTFRITMAHNAKLSAEEVSTLYRLIDDLDYVVNQITPDDSSSQLDFSKNQNILTEVYMIRTQKPDVSKYFGIIKNLFYYAGLERSPDNEYVLGAYECFKEKVCTVPDERLSSIKKAKNATYVSEYENFFNALREVDMTVVEKVNKEQQKHEQALLAKQNEAKQLASEEHRQKLKIAQRNGFAGYHEGILDFIYRFKSGYTDGVLDKSTLLIRTAYDGFQVESIVGDYVIYSSGKEKIAVLKKRNIAYFEGGTLVDDNFKLLGIEEFKTVIGTTVQIMVLQGVDIK